MSRNGKGTEMMSSVKYHLFSEHLKFSISIHLCCYLFWLREWFLKVLRYPLATFTCF